MGANEPAGFEQQQAEDEKMREELDCLVVIHKHGLEGTAQRLAAHLGLSKQFKQEIHAHTGSSGLGR